MALQLITGVSGSGKSRCAYRMISDIAACDRDRMAYVVVPDQFSHVATKILTDMNGCILNIDVLSIRRLAYRALEEFTNQARTVLSDEGKIMLLRKVIAENKDSLRYFKKGLNSLGFLDECKSLISEFIEYGVGDDEFDALEGVFNSDSRSAMKLSDLKLIYDKMEERMGQTYRMAEELVPALTYLIPDVSFLKGATICFDDFTGFTPVQYDMIGELLKLTDSYGADVIVTVTTDITDNRSDIFSLSNSTIKRLIDIAVASGVPVKETIEVGYGDDKLSYRLKDNPTLNHIERHIFSYDGEVYAADEVPAIEIRALRNERTEADFVARDILKHIRQGVAPEKIAIVSGDLKRYETHLRRALGAMSIPFFFDENHSLGSNPLAEYILNFLEMVRTGFDMVSVMRFLRGGLSPISSEQADIVENYIIASGKRGLGSFKEEWTYMPDKRFTDELLKEINNAREIFINSVSDGIESIRGTKKTISEYASAVCTLIADNNLLNRFIELSDIFMDEGDELMAKEYIDIYPAMMNVFDSMVELMGDERVSLKEFTEILSAGISGGVLTFIPMEESQVIVGDVERTRLYDIEYLYFIGNTDDIFPKGSGSVGILSDLERETIAGQGIELAPSPKELYDRELFYMYRVLTKPSIKLYLTYTKTDCAGASKRPSYLISRVSSLYRYKDKKESGLDIIDDERDTSIEALIGTDKGMSYLVRGLKSEDISETDEFKEIMRYYELHDKKLIDRLISPDKVNKSDISIEDEIAARLYGDVIKASVTRFENYVSCPYSHFLSYGLSLRERTKHQIEAFDRGNIYHNSFERLYDRMAKDDKKWSTLTVDELKTMGGECFDEEVNSYRDRLFNKDKRTEYMMGRMRHTYIDLLMLMYSQMSVGEFEQWASEVAFAPDDSEYGSDKLTKKLKSDKTLEIIGRIDRIDTYLDDNNRYIKILDYKSSAKELKLYKIYHGLELQLMTYMDVAVNAHIFNKNNENNIPAGVLFQGIDEKEFAWDIKYATDGKYDNKLRMDARPNGYVSDENVALFDSDIPKGNHTSYAVNVRSKKDGSLYAYSKVLSNEEFDLLIEHTENKISECANRIYEGSIEARPYIIGHGEQAETGCGFCPYQAVCGIEKRTQIDMERPLSELSDDDVFDCIRQDKEGSV